MAIEPHELASESSRVRDLLVRLAFAKQSQAGGRRRPEINAVSKGTLKSQRTKTKDYLLRKRVLQTDEEMRKLPLGRHLEKAKTKTRARCALLSWKQDEPQKYLK
jgi:hypothetical protein